MGGKEVAILMPARERTSSRRIHQGCRREEVESRLHGGEVESSDRRLSHDCSRHLHDLHPHSVLLVVYSACTHKILNVCYVWRDKYQAEHDLFRQEYPQSPYELFVSFS